MSDIEWTDATWNPIVGCTKISSGCDHCYAITMAMRQAGMAAKNPGKRDHYLGVAANNDWTGRIGLAHDEIVNKPMTTRKPTVYFVNSMSDMFHEGVEDAWLVRFFQIMNDCPQHIFQVLTKRPSRMARKTAELGLKWTANIWAGSTIEENKFAKPRVRELLKVPASVRFISAEPLLSALPDLDVVAVDWVITGGESGISKTVRAAAPDWFRDLRDRCRAGGTPFFFKQWGAFGEDGIKRAKGDNGHLLDGECVMEMPAVAYDMIPNPNSKWTRVEANPQSVIVPGPVAAEKKARRWSSNDEYRSDLSRDNKGRIKIDGVAARVALRKFVLDDLAQHGENEAAVIRARALPKAGLNPDDAYHVNQHAFALVDLQREGKIVKIVSSGRETYNLSSRSPVIPEHDEATWVDLVDVTETSIAMQADNDKDDVEAMWANLIKPGSRRLA